MKYTDFVKENIGKCSGDQKTRMKQVGQMWREFKAKGGSMDSFDSEGCGGKSVGGKPCGGKSVGGKSCGGKDVGGKKVAGMMPPRPHIVGGPDSLPPWSKMGIDYPQWREKFLKGLDKKQDPARMLLKPVEKGGFLQYLPLIAPLITPLITPLIKKLFGSGEGGKVEMIEEGGFLQYLPLIGKLFGMGDGGKLPPFMMDKVRMKASCGSGAKKPKAKPKAKRQPSAYNKFVKEHWGEVQGSAQERMKLLGPMWKEFKSQGGISLITEGHQY